MRFYDREEELAELERINTLCSKSTHLTVISGRRRIGKTHLVKEYTKNKNHIYMFITRKSEALLLSELSLAIRTSLGYSPTFISWDDALEYIMNSSMNNDIVLVLVLDEFQNLKYGAPSAFSQIQKVFDANKDKTKVHIVTLGSYVSMMKHLFQNGAEPLFGRATEYIELKPLDFSTIIEISKDLGYSVEDAFVLHSIFGGIPKYYVMLEEQGLQGKSIKDVLLTAFFGGFPLLGDEVRGTLIENLGKNYHPYFSILHAVASNKNTLSKIADVTGIKRDSLSKYLIFLRDDINILDYRIPPTEKRSKSKMGRYFIADELTNFWFKFVFGNLSLIEQGLYTQAIDLVMAQLPAHIGYSTEEVIRALVARYTEYHHVGRWWNRKGDEIDIVGIAKRKILFGEVKWTKNKVNWPVVESLMTKSNLVQRYKGYKKEYLVVAKSGFTTHCIERMEKEGIHHWSLDDIIGMVSSLTD